MPQNKFQKFIFALITVAFTVHAFVFYNMFDGAGVSGYFIPQGELYTPIQFLAAHKEIGIIVAVEFVCALSCELLIGSPASVRLALKVVNPKQNHPFLVETAIICCTVGIMCPLMSFIAVILYDAVFPILQVGTTPFFGWGNFFANFIPNWFIKICFNFPFALISQLFFIQPFVRTIFKALFKKQLSQSK